MDTYKRNALVGTHLSAQGYREDDFVEKQADQIRVGDHFWYGGDLLTVAKLENAKGLVGVYILNEYGYQRMFQAKPIDSVWVLRGMKRSLKRNGEGKATMGLKSGYAYVYTGSRNWKTSSDEKWENTMVDDGIIATRVGTRTIDGAKCDVFKTPQGNFYAQMAHYVRNARMKSMTYGTVPTFAEFERHVKTWKNEEGEGIKASERPVYKMELVGSDAECAQEAAQGIPGIAIGGGRKYAHKLGVEIDDIASLWAFVNSLVHHADDAFEDNMDDEGEKYRDLASSVMYTLGYEWI